MQSILPSSRAQGFPVKPSKCSSLPHSCCCSKMNPSSVFHIPHQPLLWHWSLAKPGGATVKGRTVSSPPTPRWVLWPLRGAGSKSRVAMQGLQVRGPQNRQTSSGSTWGGKHTGQGSKPHIPLQNLLPASSLLLGGLCGGCSWKEDPTREPLILL